LRNYRRYADKPKIIMQGDIPICHVCDSEAIKRERFIYCSAECRRLGSIRYSSSAIRKVAFERDRGVCAETGIDCYLLERIREQAHKPLAEHMAVAKRGSRKIGVLKRRTEEEAKRIQRRWQILWNHKILRLGIPERLWRRGSLWEADHVIPVHKGGGVCDMNNIQTLCWESHRIKTTLEKKGLRHTGRHKMCDVLKM